ncbi:MAG: PSD1 domain-containing protein [Planctomyces sp.]|nr:PSD1 domain-containing protein [Planctomyces sp.]
MRRRCLYQKTIVFASIAMALIATAFGAGRSVTADEPVQFGRDILPILSANCYACHGPDEHDRKGELRLDIESDALGEHAGGRPVVPGQPDESTIFQRLTSTDADVVMPPPDSNKTLKPEQIALIRRWIAEGGKWGRHWSFEPVQRPTISASAVNQASQHPIDVLVTSDLAARDLTLQPSAEPQIRLRRLSLDLIGLPPTPEMAARFAANPTDEEWEQIADELLASPEFGEHWARMWLDLARYADTKGYEKDLGRTMWPWRDWVVSAFNRDMPLNQFTEEQLAGDLLPNPTEQQLIATAFHRNTMSNDEGGTDDEEFRIAAVKDRVDSTIQVWMGLTMGCAKCHTHKYDPISQQEYYQVFAIFNQSEDADRYDDAPVMQVISETQIQEKAKLIAEIEAAEDRVTAAEAAGPAEAEGPVSLWTASEVTQAESTGGAELAVQPAGDLRVAGPSAEKDTYLVSLTLKPGLHRSLRLEAIPVKLPDGRFGVGRSPSDPNFVISELIIERRAGDQWEKVNLINPRADFEQNGWPITASIDGNEATGWAISPQQLQRHGAVYDFADAQQLDSPTNYRITISQQYGGRLTLSRFRISTSSHEPAELKPISDSPLVVEQRESLKAAQQKLKAFESEIANLPVMRELGKEKLRVTKIHRRGNFLDPGEEVQANILSSFGSVPAEASMNRLALARWLVHHDNPLTPRVWANRIWARLFGAGLVETEEDFGALGSMPTHPELLDWLAAEYRDGGWSLKKLLKHIVLSKTYQQSSDVTAELLNADPGNRWLSRGARFRLGAEVIRDQALAVSGLLSLKKGGPPVMPPQPAGLWRSTYSGKTWIDAEGEDRVRRGLYTYLKRTTPYPSMTTFDGGSGEVCQIRRIRTNTPLQALVTLNDPVFLEASAALAKRMSEAAATSEERAQIGLKLALIRSPMSGEGDPLVRLQKEAEADFSASPENTAEFLRISRAQIPDGMSAPEFAGWVVAANAILNLDEFLTRN